MCIQQRCSTPDEVKVKPGSRVRAKVCAPYALERPNARDDAHLSLQTVPSGCGTKMRLNLANPRNRLVIQCLSSRRFRPNLAVRVVGHGSGALAVLRNWERRGGGVQRGV